MNELMFLVDEDTNAFNKIMACFSMPKTNDQEKAERAAALQAATIYATEVPFRPMECAFNAFELSEAMAKEGNPNSVSDAGVGALCIRTAIQGAYLNVKINAVGIKDRAIAENILNKAKEISELADKKEREILAIVEEIINK